MTQSRHVFHRHTQSDLPVAVRGDGIYLFDSNGKRYLDASGGAAVSCLGHGHPRVTAALEVQRIIKDDDLLANVRRQGDNLRRSLARSFGEHPHVGDIRGRGLLQAIELVADPETREPFDPALGLNARVKREAMARGLMCYPMGGTVDGRIGDHVMLAPPFIIDEQTIETISSGLREAVDAAVASTRR